MDETVELIERYKARLNPENEFKKIFRALQKLNEIDMTIELLQATGIGKAVNGLRKKKGLGEFAKEIVNKWRKLTKNNSESLSSSTPSKEYVPKGKKKSVEYDPAQNWKMKKISSSYQPSVKQEQPDDDEYDPSGNWQMETSENGDASNSYSPATSPVKKRKEKISPSKSKKVKKERVEAERRDRNDKSPGTDREAELLLMLQRTQKELEKIKKQKRKPEVKVEKESPERPMEYDPCETNGSYEEYDPSTNFELSGSSPAQDEDEYDPGSGDETTNYQPCMNSDPSSRLSDDDDNNSDASYDEDEPGAYLLHPRRTSSDYGRRRSSGNSDDGSVQNTSDSFVQSTTLYSRNKSIDSEDGTWGSKVNGIKAERDDDITFHGHTSKNTEISSKKSSKTKKEIKYSKNSENESKIDKKVKIKQEKTDLGKKDKKSRNSEKRISDSIYHEPSKKKPKVSSTGLERSKLKSSEVKDAGFLFEDIPDVSKSSKRKKKTKKFRKPVEITKISVPKVSLNLPEIQATYRPLPTISDNSRKTRRRSAEAQMTDSQAAELHSQRQTKKMLVYSGGGGGFLSKMMSLFDQCMAVLMNNIDAIDTFGGIPYDIVHPILKKCSPEQLYRLEDSNPYLLEDTDALWQQHATNEFRGKQPEEMESWREMFLRLSDEREAKLRNLTQMIQAKEAKKKPLEKKVMLAYVGANAKPPRSVRRAQEKFGTGVRSRSSGSSSISSRSTASAVRRDLVNSRMSVPVGSITAASVDREERWSRAQEVKKPRVAPMMAKTLKSMGKMRMRMRR